MPQTGRPALQCLLSGHTFRYGWIGFCTRPGCQTVALPSREHSESDNAYRAKLSILTLPEREHGDTDQDYLERILSVLKSPGGKNG